MLSYVHKQHNFSNFSFERIIKIWRERNNQTSQDQEQTGDQLLALFAGTFFAWSCAWGVTSRDSIPSFLDSLFCCTLFS